MSWSAAQITSLRTLVDDSVTSKQARAETPQNARDGARKVFQLLHYPIVASSVYLTTGATIRTQTGYTVDLVNGLLTFTVAPTGLESPWYVDYYWQWLPDSAFTEFLDNASYDIGFNPTIAVPIGLTNAFNNYGAYHFYKAMAAKYAWRFNSAGGGQGQNVDVVTQNWRKLADEAKTEGDSMKAEFYKRHGAREAPAIGTASMSIDPFTPMR